MVTRRRDVNEDIEMSEKVKEKTKMGWSSGGKGGGGGSKRNKTTKNVNVESSMAVSLNPFI